MTLAWAYECRLTVSRLGVKPVTSSVAKPTASATSSTVVSSMPRPRFSRLSPEELAAKRANGEWYYCPEKISNDHKCKSKSVFLLEMHNSDEPGTITEDLGISLHALTGIDVANTMKLHIQIHGQTLVALVDTGSTHTFIKETMVPHLGLLATPR
jgi:hypothetical protein